MAEYNGKQGVWRTVGGRRIFIVNGQDLPTAMKESGKFNKKEEFNEKEYEKYETAKEFDFLKNDYSYEEWEKLEKKYSNIYNERKDKKWYLRVKSEPYLMDIYKKSERFKKLDKKYKNEWEEEQEKIHETILEATKGIVARDKEKRKREKY